MSTLTWLDFSDAERKRALQVVELLGRPETRDELGLGAIRDAFANALFPGMSTVQRRARYFLRPASTIFNPANDSSKCTLRSGRPSPSFHMTVAALDPCISTARFP